MSRVITIGGFLGAGKTTSISKMVEQLSSEGQKVAIVTNDQGSNLVDTEYLKQEGFYVAEVEGGCFCCNFNTYAGVLNNIKDKVIPDVILTEPVGSCTDLIATLFNPLKKNFMEAFTLSPLSVVVDPQRVEELLISGNSDFPQQVNYLFEKQLEEADIIVINKIDLYDEDYINKVSAFLQNKYPMKNILKVSAKDEIGIDNWVNMLMNNGYEDKEFMEMDYITYGEAEKFLGWFNCNIKVNHREGIDFNDFAVNLINKIKRILIEEGNEIAHLKIFGQDENNWAKVSLTGNNSKLDFNRKMDQTIKDGSIIINARVNILPENLQSLIISSLEELVSMIGIDYRIDHIESFQPGEPNPDARAENLKVIL